MHYGWDYESKGRFSSYWHQIDEVISFFKGEKGTVLIVGKGSGFVEHYLRQNGFDVKTIDIDADLKPDFLGSVKKMPFLAESFDMVLCCQVLEHLEFSAFEESLLEIKRVLKKNGSLILSLPDLQRLYKCLFQIPKLGEIRLFIEIWVPEFLKREWKYNGEHYWNIANKTFPLKKVRKVIFGVGFLAKNEYRVFELPWHRFFVLDVSS